MLRRGEVAQAELAKYMLPSAASRPDKVDIPVEMQRSVSMIQKVLKTVEVPQNQPIDKAAKCTPVDLGPAMAERLGRRGVLRYSHTSTPLKHFTSPRHHQRDTRTHEVALCH